MDESGRPLRIAVLAREMMIGGAERQVAYLAAGLARRGHTVALFTFYPGNAFADALAGSGVEVISLDKAGRWDPGFLGRLRRRLAEFRPDVVHTILAAPNVVAALLRPLLPKHALIWSVLGTDLNLADYDAPMRALVAVERRLARFADLIISNSHAGRRDAIGRGFPAQGFVVVPNGFETDRFAIASPEQRAQARAAIGVGPDELAVGICARLDPMKDHPTFLRAMAAVAAKRPLRAVVVGPAPGPRREPLERLAAELGLTGKVVWLGASVATHRIYPAFDVFCLTSAAGEGLPNVLGEAMACGIPCVATDVGDCALVLEGLLPVVPRRDPEAIAKAVLELSEPGGANADLPRRLRQRILDRYSMEAMIAGTEAQFVACWQSRRT